MMKFNLKMPTPTQTIFVYLEISRLRGKFKLIVWLRL